ncbi:MAG: hypothetical protein LBT97_09565, partial [Planctomycetota bacterium]|nr:hypothetical protein [Planctomycetota bacterium]
RELLQGRRYRPTGRKINPLVRKRQHLWRKSGGGWSDFLQKSTRDVPAVFIFSREKIKIILDAK